jgi:hypothetical protein
MTATQTTPQILRWRSGGRVQVQYHGRARRGRISSIHRVRGAVECVVHGVPCFLCEWLDLWPYGYIGQFRKFGVAIGLHSPSDIEKIPEMLTDYHPNEKTAEDCFEVIAPERLDEILAGRKTADVAPAGMQRAQ